MSRLTMLREMSKTGLRVIIVIPALNEAETISHVVKTVSAYGTALVVDDGSSDGTGCLAQDAGAHTVVLNQNGGYERAIEAGFDEADRLGAEIVITFDADNQFDAELLATVAEPLQSGRADIVIGNRGEYARISEWLFGCYTKLRFGVPDILCGLKGYRMDLYRRHGRFDSGRSVGTELALHALRAGSRCSIIPTPTRPREVGMPRFGRGIGANLRILTAFRDAIGNDLKHCLRRSA